MVCFAEVGDSRLMSRALGTHRRCLVAAPAYLAAKGVPLIPDDLTAHAWLHHKFPTSEKLGRWPLLPAHAGIETELPRTAVASTIEPLICMAEQGVGIWVSPICATSPYAGNFVKAYSSPCSTTTPIAPGPFGSYGRRAGISLPSSECS